MEHVLLSFCLCWLLYFGQLNCRVIRHALPTLLEPFLQLCLDCLISQELVVVRYHSSPQLLLRAVVRNLFLFAPLLHCCNR